MPLILKPRCWRTCIIHNCLDTLELSYVDKTMGLLIMLSRTMGNSLNATQ